MPSLPTPFAVRVFSFADGLICVVSLTYKSLNLLELLENLKTTSLRTAPLSVRFSPFRERTPC